MNASVVDSITTPALCPVSASVCVGCRTDGFASTGNSKGCVHSSSLYTGDVCLCACWGKAVDSWAYSGGLYRSKLVQCDTSDMQTLCVVAEMPCSYQVKDPMMCLDS